MATQILPVGTDVNSGQDSANFTLSEPTLVSMTGKFMAMKAKVSIAFQTAERNAVTPVVVLNSAMSCGVLQPGNYMVIRQGGEVGLEKL